MLKRILIFALILNTPYIMPSDSYANTESSASAALIGTLAGTICAWLTYKDLKKGWQDYKELDRHLKILNEMGIKVYKVSKVEFEWDSFVTTESYTMDIPSHFSPQQEKKAKKHWRLLLSSDKDVRDMRVWPTIGSLLLIPIGIHEFYKTFFEPIGSDKL